MAEEFNPTEWITIGEAAALTGYAAGYLRQLIAKGRLRARKRGRDWFLDKADVLAYGEAMKELGRDKYNPWRPAYNSPQIDTHPSTYICQSPVMKSLAQA